MSDSSSGDPFVTLTVTPDDGLGFVLDAMEATEELGRPFLIVLDVSSETPKGDLHAMLGGTATVTLKHPDKPTRYFNGIIARAGYRGLSSGSYRYQLQLRPWIWLLSKKQDCRIFSAQSAWAIITGVFRDAGFTDFSDKRQNDSGSVSLDFTVQYRESSLDFVTRLMERFGLYYYCTHSDGAHQVVFADDPNSHTSVGTLPYQYEYSRWRSAADHIWNWSGEARIEPGAFTFDDYNFTTPNADLTAKSLLPGGHTYGDNEVFDYPGQYDVVADGQTAAQIRMQDLDGRRLGYGGASNSRLLGCGGKFTLSDSPDTAANAEYLITSSVCTIRQAEAQATSAGDIVDTFRCAFTAIGGTRPFRLAPVTPRPVIRGPQTARVAGEQGQEITTDQYGRIKVKFPWDRRAASDENSSCWIRVSQVWAGTAWGAMFIPRIGQEVVVEFLEGNPDRPLVTGQVYNAVTTVPYALPDNATRSTLKSNSSQGGGGFNELRFEDKKGSEEVFFQAQKDLNITVLNNRTETITQDQTTTLSQGNRATTVSQGNETLTVSQGNRSVTVSAGNDSLTVSKGNRSVTVSAGNDSLTVSQGSHSISVSAGSSTVEANTAITLKVGENSIKIEPSGITISAVKVTVTAQTALEASGLTAKVAGSTSLELDGGASAKLVAGIVQIN